MLDQALKVVEAARGLRLEQKGKTTGSSLEKNKLSRSIEALRKSLEDFDQETGFGLKEPVNVFRPDFASPPQLDEDGFIEAQQIIEEGHSVSVAPPHPELVDTAEDELKKDSTSKPISTTPEAVPRMLIPAMSARAAREYFDASDDLGDNEINDGAESVGDFLISLDLISDKLEYAVARVGWTPRLRALAEAANIARNKMTLDVSDGNCYARVPADTWAMLTISIVDAVMDMDNKLSIPAPNMNPAQEYDYDRAPKPPQLEDY